MKYKIKWKKKSRSRHGNFSFPGAFTPSRSAGGLRSHGDAIKHPQTTYATYEREVPFLHVQGGRLSTANWGKINGKTNIHAPVCLNTTRQINLPTVAKERFAYNRRLIAVSSMVLFLWPMAEAIILSQSHPTFNRAKLHQLSRQD